MGKGVKAPHAPPNAHFLAMSPLPAPQAPLMDRNQGSASRIGGMHDFKASRLDTGMRMLLSLLHESLDNLPTQIKSKDTGKSTQKICCHKTDFLS
jgi:hypothetical protein